MSKLTKESSIFLTGGIGSFGKSFLNRLLKNNPEQSVTIYSRDELKQYNLALALPIEKFPNIDFVLGDIRDRQRVIQACEGHSVVVHAAALKHVPAAERNPTEFIRTNVDGAQNVISACSYHGIDKCVALSTDKACAPINLYGATKLCSDKLFIAANLSHNKAGTIYSVVRYGNVMASRGSVIPFFLGFDKKKPLPVTHEEMTRFNITLEQSIDTILWALENCNGGEIVVPKIPSYSIIDLVKAIRGTEDYIVTGIREGEKLHEEMITSSDSLKTVLFGDKYLILPPWIDSGNYKQNYNLKVKIVPMGFSYSSGLNEEFLTVEQLTELISTIKTK